MSDTTNLPRYGDSVYLVSCVSKKRSKPARAKDLYVSDWFRKARAYVEKMRQPWYILSAKYGLVHPETIISPYEQTLNNMRVAERRKWAQETRVQLEPHLVGVRSVIFLAGNRYREHLEPSLRERGIDVAIPMEGLRIGEQLRWLNCHLPS